MSTPAPPSYTALAAQPPPVAVHVVIRKKPRSSEDNTWRRLLFVMIAVSLVVTMFALGSILLIQGHFMEGSSRSVRGGGEKLNLGFAMKHILTPDMKRGKWDGGGCHTFSCMKQGIGPERILKCPGGIYKFAGMKDADYHEYAAMKSIFPDAWDKNAIERAIGNAWNSGKKNHDRDSLKCNQCQYNGAEITIVASEQSQRGGRFVITAYPDPDDRDCTSVNEVKAAGMKFEVW